MDIPVYNIRGGVVFGLCTQCMSSVREFFVFLHHLPPAVSHEAVLGVRQQLR